MKHYYLINTMSKIQGTTVGRVVSGHRTRGAAKTADDKLQRMTKGANGQNSYLPTIIIMTNTAMKCHDSVYCCDEGDVWANAFNLIEW